VGKPLSYPDGGGSGSWGVGALRWGGVPRRWATGGSDGGGACPHAPAGDAGAGGGGGWAGWGVGETGDLGLRRKESGTQVKCVVGERL